MKTALCIGSVLLLLVGAVVSFFSFGYLDYLRVPYPLWLHNICLFAPAVFVGVALALRRLPLSRRLWVAGSLGCCIAAIPYFVYSVRTESVRLSRVMTDAEHGVLIHLTRGRFIVWFPESPHSSVLLSADADGSAAKQFFAAHGLL